jgi:hypothetical protein
LRIAELVWGDGVNTHRRIIDLQSTPAFYEHEYAWLVDTPHGEPHGEPGQAGQAGVDVGAVCGLGCGRRRRVHQSDLA